MLKERKIYDRIMEWANLYFSINPYGEPIPDEFLYSATLIRPCDRHGNKVFVRCLADMKQNGYSIEYLKNDDTKKEAFEKEETISFSEIFHELLDTDTLCPSNYIVTIINRLKKYDISHGIEHSNGFYCGTIARGMRAFASYLRELSLAEIIKTVVGAYARRCNKEFSMISTSVEEDIYKNTDICFSYDGKTYRVWSYQTTSAGVIKTGNRIKRAHGTGLNLLMPFNFEMRKECMGWYLYDYVLIRPLLYDTIINEKEAIAHTKYCMMIKTNKYIIKTPTVIEIA